MNKIHCPKCGAKHDGAMDANGWATCKNCVHLWNLQKEDDAQDETPAPMEGLAGEAVEKDPTTGYFPNTDGKQQTAALTKKEAEVLMPAQDYEATESQSALPAVELPAVRMPETTPVAVQTSAHCPICGATALVEAGQTEASCEHCETSFHVQEDAQTADVPVYVSDDTGSYSISGSSLVEVAEDSVDPLIGTIIGGCEIIRKLGEGGMGSVYMAKQKSLDRDVAIKLLPRNLTMQSNFMDRFKQEARSLAQINHNNIIGIYELGEEPDSGQHFMMMEYVNGEDVADFLRKRHHVSAKESLDIILQSAKGLEQAALKGIIHRDIKPENIIMTQDGVCKVSDFGLAKNVASSATMTNASIRVGTPAFMSPEQCDGLQLDFKSDIYSLGVTWFVLLTGHLPFNGESPFSIMLKHKTEPAPAVSDSMADIHPALSACIQKMMAKEPEKRFPSWRSLCEELGHIEAIVLGHGDAQETGEPISEQADFDDDISSIMNGLGGLERSGSDNLPGLGAQSDEHDMSLPSASAKGLPSSEYDDITGSPDPFAAIVADMNGSQPATASPVDAAPAAVPMPPSPAMGSTDFMNALGLEPEPEQHSIPEPIPEPIPERIPDTVPEPIEAFSQAPVPVSAPLDATVSISASSKSDRLRPQESERYGSGIRHGSGIRQGEHAKKIQSRVAEAHTHAQDRVSQILDRGDLASNRGKHKKAVKIWESALLACSDAESRGLCERKIRIAHMFIAQQRKRRALVGMALLVPTLIASTFFSTPVAHEYYLQWESQQIAQADVHEKTREKRWQRLAQLAAPFEWYETVFLGTTYDLPSAREVLNNANIPVETPKGATPDEDSVTSTSEERVDILSLNDLQTLEAQIDVSWREVYEAAMGIIAYYAQQEERADYVRTGASDAHKKEAQRIADVSRKHIIRIKHLRQTIDTTLRAGQCAEACALAETMRQQELRAGESLVGLPVQVTLEIRDMWGQAIKNAAVSVNGIRIHGDQHAYSLLAEAVHIEIKHKDYHTFIGDIAPAAGQFSAPLQNKEQWSTATDYTHKADAWVNLLAADGEYFFLSNASGLTAHSATNGHVYDSLQRTDINKAIGLGSAYWENSVHVQRNKITVGSADGLLLDVAFNKQQKKMEVQQIRYEGRHRIVDFVEYDFVFRSGSCTAVIQQRGRSAAIYGMVNGQKDWEYTGLSAKRAPQIFHKNEQLYVIDDHKFYVLEENGDKQEHIPLADPCVGTAIWMNDETLIYPYRTGIAVLNHEQGRYRVHRGVELAPPVGDIQVSEERMFIAGTDGTVKSFVFNKGVLYQEWSQKIDGDEGCAFGVSYGQGLVCVTDTVGGIYIYNARTGKKLQKIDHQQALATAPLLSFNRLIFMDITGKMVAYTLPSVR